MPSSQCVRRTALVSSVALLAGCQLVIGYDEGHLVEDLPYGASGISCLGGLDCKGGSCCKSGEVYRGSFSMGDGTTAHKAVVDDFRLDVYEVTVGRFRRFVNAYDGSPPPPGAGAVPSIPESGWKQAWNQYLPPSRSALEQSLACGQEPDLRTWTGQPQPGGENRPINCVWWYLAFAFCAWDGGRLPTETEWEYAAAGGAEHRIYPWGADEPEATLAVFDCVFSGDKSCTSSDLPEVGSLVNGEGRWGHLDLAGSLAEWVMDGYPPVYQDNCNPCIHLDGDQRGMRGGSFDSGADVLKRTHAKGALPTNAFNSAGLRCARVAR